MKCFIFRCFYSKSKFTVKFSIKFLIFNITLKLQILALCGFLDSRIVVGKVTPSHKRQIKFDPTNES